MKYLFLAGGLVLLMASCAQKKEQEQHSNYRVSADTVIIPDSSNLLPKLKTDTVKEVLNSHFSSSSGTVKAIPNYYAEIAAPFSGRVLQVFMKLGMKVQSGTPLFKITSTEFMETQKAFFAAKSEFKKAELELKRQRDLRKNEVGSAKDLEEATSSYELISKEYEHARAALKIYQVDPDKMVLGEPLIIRSPIKGEVIENEMVTGQYLKSDDPAKAKVADLKKVWITAQVKEKDISQIQEGMETEMDVMAYPGRKIRGRVYHIEEILDEDTRSLQVLIECDNQDSALKPGMYVTVNFKGKEKNTMMIPVGAVMQMNEESFVFVQSGQGKYIRRKVITGATANGMLVVSSGLHVGEKIITAGGFYLLEAK